MTSCRTLRSLFLTVALGSSGASLSAQGLPDWVRADAGSRTVTLTLTTAPAAGSAAINGFRDGAVQIVVPVGWTVRWRWESRDSSATHSLVVMAEREKLPERGGRPVFANAMTRAVTTGMRAGQVDEASFTADQAGWYWILCGVPEHALTGEWIGLKVDAGANEPSIVRRER